MFAGFVVYQEDSQCYRHHGDTEINFSGLHFINSLLIYLHKSFAWKCFMSMTKEYIGSLYAGFFSGPDWHQVSSTGRWLASRVNDLCVGTKWAGVLFDHTGWLLVHCSSLVHKNTGCGCSTSWVDDKLALGKRGEVNWKTKRTLLYFMINV